MILRGFFVGIGIVKVVVWGFFCVNFRESGFVNWRSKGMFDVGRFDFVICEVYWFLNG